MAATAVQRKPWTARDYILGALGGCLAATAIVIVVSVVLRPGRIVFSVTHATRNTTDDGGVDLRFTIRANNTSHHARVKYISFYVVVTNSSSSAGMFSTDARVETTFPIPNPNRGDGYLTAADPTTEIKASVHMLAGDMVSFFAGHRLESNATGLTVVLMSQVRFRIGVAPTKIFDIKVSCPGVTFVQEQPKPQAQQAVTCDG